ncbi:MAG: hypothetical protein IIA66_08290, partial [Planctomycetes bacterium]|nr:hypothetical protein [Planctomycetota bacterium]
TFPPGTPATIDVDTSALPALSVDSVTIDASNAGVIIEDTDGDLANGAHGLTISGNTNTIKGLRIKYFDAGPATYGIYITGVGNTIGGTYNSGASNSLGDACQISLNYHGVFIDGVGADSNIVKGNLIGTAINGTADEGNTGYGIWVYKGDLNVIGSTTSGEENRIAFNGDATYPYGIWLESNADDNTMRGNVIWDNNGVAIGLDSIAQNTISAPVISDDASTTQVDGTSGASNTVDVYSNTAGDSDCLAYLGSTTADVSGNWSLGGLSLTNGEYVVAIQTDTNGNSSSVSTAALIGAPQTAVYCYNAYAGGWETGPVNMTDCNTASFARTITDMQVQELTAHALESGSAGSGTITKVQVRYLGAFNNGPGNGSGNQVWVTPVFNGTTDGDVHNPGALSSSATWTNWLDITNDTNAPVTWTWTDITNLDLDITASVVGGKAQVYKVELSVIYTP